MTPEALCSFAREEGDTEGATAFFEWMEQGKFKNKTSREILEKRPPFELQQVFLVNAEDFRGMMNIKPGGGVFEDEEDIDEIIAIEKTDNHQTLYMKGDATIIATIAARTTNFCKAKGFIKVSDEFDGLSRKQVFKPFDQGAQSDVNPPVLALVDVI